MFALRFAFIGTIFAISILPYVFSNDQSSPQLDESSINASDQRQQLNIERLKVKQSINSTTFFGPYNANNESLYVELILVVDNDIYKEKKRNSNVVHKYCKDIANIINSFYASLNIFVALVGVVVWTEKNEIELSSNYSKTLKSFAKYREMTLLKDYPNDSAHLLTNTTFDAGILGTDYVGQICSDACSAGVSIVHSENIDRVAATIARGLGFNLGMNHYPVRYECSNQKPCKTVGLRTSFLSKEWSPISKNDLKKKLQTNSTQCLRNIPNKLFAGPTCGNGFIEIGEECDCGMPDTCNNEDCDPKTCKLKLKQCDKNCSGNGKCNTTSGECLCNRRYALPDCAEKSCPSNCSGHGKCDKKLGFCHCDPGYTLSNCARRIQKSCSKDCSGHGRCDEKSGVCHCREGYKSTSCAENSCPNRCSGHGYCDKKLGVCRCYPGYTSSDCAVRIQKSCPNNCSGNGQCDMNRGVCHCDPGYVLPDCAEKSCPRDCSGHGECDRTIGVCHCHAGYASPDCRGIIRKPCPNNCSRNGQCDMNRGVCHCDPGYTSPNCAGRIRIPEQHPKPPPRTPRPPRPCRGRPCRVRRGLITPS